MIFKAQLLEQIFAGEKTVTRRPPGGILYEVGKTYAIQPGMARESVGRIRIVSWRSELLGAIDDAEARLEGFPDEAAFRLYWTALYGKFDENLPVARIEFELLEQTHEICSCCGGSGVEEIEAE